VARTSPKRVDRSGSQLWVRTPAKKKSLYFYELKNYLKYGIRYQK